MIHRRILAGVSALVLSVGAVAGTINSSMPPKRFQQDAGGVLNLQLRTDLRPVCGDPPKGKVFLGCVLLRDSTLGLQNPCMPKFAGEQYAKIACHELAHLNGWSGEHER